MTAEHDLAGLQEELAYERRALAMSERADGDGRVCDRTLWLSTLEKRRARVGALEADVALLRALVAA